jgi:hypothetical protein
MLKTVGFNNRQVKYFLDKRDEIKAVKYKVD